MEILNKEKMNTEYVGVAQKRYVRWSSIRLCALWFIFIQLIFIMRAEAATQPINTVAVKVNSKLGTGRKLPSDILIGKSSVGDNEVAVSTSGGTYKITAAEWTSGGDDMRIKSGDQPTMTVTLEPTDISKHYFLSSYRNSNVTITGGTFTSASKEGDNLTINLKMDPIKGKFEEPTDIYWNDDKLGEIRWTRPDNTSGKYELQLMRNSTKVTSTTTSGLLYDFYPYMTQAGKYYVNIRTIVTSTEEGRYAQNSEWVSSADLTITDRDVSDGKGQDGGGTAKSLYKYGWYKENGFWYYRYLDDNHLQGGGWARIDNEWYFFNQYGQMQTGWQIINDRTFFLLKTGAMYTGWMKNGDDWYYLIPQDEVRNGEIWGQTANSGWRLINSHYYYFKSNGAMYTGWLYENGKYYFLNDIDNSLYGVMFTGWIHRNNKTYYCDYDGTMVEGWRAINDNLYYFYPGSGQMAVNAYVDGYFINYEGIRQ
ncbi:putative cell wall binding protein [Lachnospiraceae bacterium JC7]|nr:putative cell wall binding protein [Lachnospiraceae bacterium JC7]